MKVLLSITLTDLVKIWLYLFVFLLKRQKTESNLKQIRDQVTEMVYCAPFQKTLLNFQHNLLKKLFLC